MKIYLIRHGQTDWNLDGRIMGRSDIPLNRAGLGQARKTADFLKGKGIKRLYSSPVKRCIETAMIIGKVLGLDPIPEKGFTEIDFGDWGEKVYDELRKAPRFRSYYEFPDEEIIPGGERFVDAYYRVTRAFKMELKQNQEDFAIVSHADPIKLIVQHVLEVPLPNAARLRIDNGSVTCMRFGDGFKLDYLNVVVQ